MIRLDSSRRRTFWFGGTGLVLALGCATPEPVEVPDGSGGSGNTEGGAPSSGGSSSGATSFGGSVWSGGASMGGVSSSGGVSAGGASSGGATTTSGGTTAKGGSTSGGSTGSGGASSSGGTQGGGGAGAKGGSTSSGGATSGGSTSTGGVLQGSGGSTGGSAGAATGGAGGGGTTCSGAVFCDDFEDGNSTGWTPTGGTWTVTSDGSQVYSGGLGSYLSTAGSAQGNQTVQARMKVLTMSSGSSYRAGIVARSSGSNYYTLALDGAGDFRLLKGSSSVSGASGTCDTIASNLGSITNTWMTLKMVVSGTASSVHITTFRDSTALHDCTTTSGTVASGVGGVMTYGSNTRAEFDDFQVSSP